MTTNNQKLKIDSYLMKDIFIYKTILHKMKSINEIPTQVG